MQHLYVDMATDIERAGSACTFVARTRRPRCTTTSQTTDNNSGSAKCECEREKNSVWRPSCVQLCSNERNSCTQERSRVRHVSLFRRLCVRVNTGEASHNIPSGCVDVACVMVDGRVQKRALFQNILCIFIGNWRKGMLWRTALQILFLLLGDH